MTKFGSFYGMSTLATKLPKTAILLLPFRETMLPFSATIASATFCCRFRQLCC